MTTHDIDAVLRNYLTGDGYIAADDIPVICADIEADRKTTERQFAAYKRLVNSLESRLTDIQAQYDELKKSTNPELLASERAANAILTEELEADRKRRGEPVYQVNMKGCGWEDCSLDRYESAGRAMEQDAKKGLKRWQRRILWSAPQPTEPVEERPETTSEHIARDIREGRFPKKSERQTVPAEPVKRRYAQGTALGEFGVIPMCDQVDDEPVKEPSDAELEKAWDSFEAEMARHPTDDELEEFMAQFADEQGNIADDRHAEAARAVLSRYGDSQPKPSNSTELKQPAASAGPVKTDSVGYTLGPISDGGMDPRNEQPTKPVKIPSDADMAAIWDEVHKPFGGAPFLMSNVEYSRILLARYGRSHSKDQE